MHTDPTDKGNFKKPGVLLSGLIDVHCARAAQSGKLQYKAKYPSTCYCTTTTNLLF